MHSNAANKKIIHLKLSYTMGGVLFIVHNELRRYCKEKQYQDVFEEKLKQLNIIYEREKKLPLSTDISGNQVDFLVDSKILIDFKAKKFLLKDDYYQMKRYLKAASLRLGLIVNFRDRYLKPKRVLN